MIKIERVQFCVAKALVVPRDHVVNLRTLPITRAETNINIREYSIV